MFNRKTVRAAVLIAAALSLSIAPAASASVNSSTVTPLAITKIEGSHTCGPSERVKLIVTVNSPGTVYFDEYKNGRWVTVGMDTVSTTAVHTYALRTVKWKVLSDNLAYVGETCA